MRELCPEVPSGKSTMIGHLLFKAGAVDLRVIDRFKRQAAEIGRPADYFAWVTSTLKPERELGTTVGFKQAQLITEKRQYTLIDVPGRVKHLRHLIAGVSTADAAVIVVSAVPNEFDSSQSSKVREHALIAKAFGINQLIVAINKMDVHIDQVNYSEVQYNEVKDKMLNTLLKIGYKADRVSFIPVSAWEGVNLIQDEIGRAGTIPWYKGLTLIESLDKLKAPLLLDQKPLRIPLQVLYNI